MEEEAAAPPRPRRWPMRLAKALAALVLTLVLGIAAIVAFLDTGPGHRFIADRIAELSPSSGLKIHVGRIEGSIWGATRLRDVRLYDPEGLFAESPLIEMDWRPASWIANRLDIHRLQSGLVTLHRLPRLRPSPEPRPILPGFDIRIGRLEIAQLRLGGEIAGEPRTARLVSRADIRSGRALIDLAADVRGGGDRLRLLLDAEPDRDRFDLDVAVDSPEGGVIGALIGTRRPLAIRVDGDGRWSAWGGNARMTLSGQPVADLALAAENGAYRLTGSLAPAQFLTGKLARLSAPAILIRANATLADRRLAGTLSLSSAALRAVADGTIDLATSGFDGVRIGVDLLRPPALFPNMTGRSVRLTALLDGPFSRAAFAYRLTAPRFAFDDTGFEDARAEGRGRLSPTPVSVPIRFTARRVTGVGDVAGGILANLRVEGVLKVDSRRLAGDGLVLASNKLNGKLGLLVDLVTGQYSVVVSGGLTRYLIPGLGLVDVTSELRVVPGPGGRGTVVTGTGRAWVRRFDNQFLAGLAGGLPQIETGLVRGADGVVHFRGLRLVAPAVRIAGNGYRRRDGSFFFEGGGEQSQYGPFTMTLDGAIDRPRLAIRLERPADALGLADVRLDLDPTPEGYAYRAEGGSHLGPFQSNGAILLPRDAPATIQVARLAVSGTNAAGALRSDPDGFTGRLAVSGGGLDGSLAFNPVGEVQRIAVDLTATDARFAGPPPIAIRRGRMQGVILLDPAGTSIEGSFSGRGLSRGPLSIANVDAKANLRGGRGRVEAKIAGTRGRDFALALAADIAPDRIRLEANGTIDRRPFSLSEPAVLTRAGEAWRLAPTALTFSGGSARIGGRFGDEATELEARVDAMPLTILDIAWPELGLGGVASGNLSYRAPDGGAPPTGSADLRIRGLTRSGLVLSSRPVDVGVVAKLDGASAALRAVATSEGRTVGRAQARLSPIGGSGNFADRLLAAPLFAQVRYNGPADTLWRLTGLELFDISGPVAVGADARGTLADPVIRGSLRTEQARLESAITGTVVENIKSSGRFDGSRLVLDSFVGTTRGGGGLSGRGVFDLAAARGFGIDVALQADNAQLIDRDDIKARVTGPLTVRSDGSGGTIAGDLQLNSGSFRLGSATAAAQVPRLPVRELNRPADEALPAPIAPWRLALDVNARNRLAVTGLGITSEWSADLDIGGTVTDPRIQGRADLVRGSYDFAGRRFDLERGTIRFQGESPINPVLDIVAEGGIQGLNATIRVTGRGQQPEIAFTSTPALPQDELLSRLLFGTSITNLSAPEALQLASAVASLNQSGGGLDPINAVRSAIGLDRLRILPADIVTGQGTSIAAGRYLTRRVYVEVITDGQGYSATQVEYQITRWLSLLSTISTIGRESVNVRVSRDY